MTGAAGAGRPAGGLAASRCRGAWSGSAGPRPGRPRGRPRCAEAEARRPARARLLEAVLLDADRPASESDVPMTRATNER